MELENQLNRRRFRRKSASLQLDGMFNNICWGWKDFSLPSDSRFSTEESSQNKWWQNKHKNKWSFIVLKQSTIFLKNSGFQLGMGFARKTSSIWTYKFYEEEFSKTWSEKFHQHQGKKDGVRVWRINFFEKVKLMFSGKWCSVSKKHKLVTENLSARDTSTKIDIRSKILQICSL